MKQRIKDFLTTDHVPRWQTIVFGVAVICVTFVANWIQEEHYYRKSSRDGQLFAAQQRLESRKIEIERHAVEFQTYAGAYVSAVLEGSESIDDRRSALIDNIIAQDSAVDLSRSIFGSGTSRAAVQYRSALRDMRNSIENVDGVISMGPFWESASRLLVARNELLAEIERQISKGS